MWLALKESEIEITALKEQVDALQEEDELLKREIDMRESTTHTVRKAYFGE